MTGLLKTSTASRPSKPLALVETARLWKAEKFSTLIHEGQHVAGDVGVVAGNGRKICVRRKWLLFVPHQFEHRVDRALRGHHGRGRDFVDLNDRRLASRAKCKDRRGHGFGVAALV